MHRYIWHGHCRNQVRLVRLLLLVIQRTFPPISPGSSVCVIGSIISFFVVMRWRSGGAIGSWRWIVLLAPVVNGGTVIGSFSLFMDASLISGLRNAALNFISSVISVLLWYLHYKLFQVNYKPNLWNKSFKPQPHTYTLIWICTPKRIHAWMW